MKPTRGLSQPWLRQMPRERRVAMGSLALLVALLGSLVLYQRFAAPPEVTEPLASAPDVQAPTVAEGVRSETQPAGPNLAAVTSPPVMSSPLRGKHSIARAYGFMRSEQFGDFRLHPGIDFDAIAGEAVLAVAPGRVIRMEEDPAEGRVIELDHGNGLVTRYGNVAAVKVALNATVQPGAELGQIGAGSPTHLHFEVLVNGNPVDPTDYVRP